MNEATHRELVHQFNNFLTLCMTHAEVALETERPEEMTQALRWILDGSRRLAPLTRTGVQRQLPFAAAEQEHEVA